MYIILVTERIKYSDFISENKELIIVHCRLILSGMGVVNLQYLLISVVSIVVMYAQAIKKGMPVKRWLVLAGLLGPVAWCLFNLHYRRALVRCVGIQACTWRP
ncbi:hypothetical protein H5201_09065 [Pseudoalteromonas sp. SG43-6]|uniref:hypothetical protein n=1 Tax=Pseudoalteromonas sp. SG43-6 TaxID=2760967 RepID=UPI001603B8A5|nr:hypothetical protein [Pseudoalteromonas sp. SG43-6]